MRNKKEVISFRQTIPPNTTVTLKERVKADGTVEDLRVRFYPGQQRDLHVIPYVKHKGNKNEDMITYGDSTTDRFLSGDDDYLVFPVVVSVENDDQIVITAINTNTLYSYSLAVDVVIDYYGGKNRVAGGVIS